MTPELFVAYCRTTYVCRTPGGEWRLRVGACDPAFQEWLRCEGATHWCVVTAANPGSVLDTPESNAARHAELLRIVAECGWRCFPSTNVADDVSWPPENSCLVLVPNVDAATELGRRFRQNAVLYAEWDTDAEILLTSAASPMVVVGELLDDADPIVEWAARRVLERAG